MEVLNHLEIFGIQFLVLVDNEMKKFLKQLNILEFVYSIIVILVTLLLFIPFYVFDLIPESNLLFILLWILLADVPFLIIVSIFKKGKFYLPKKKKMITYVIFNSILVLIASVVLITSENSESNLEIFFFFISIQSFLGSMIK